VKINPIPAETKTPYSHIGIKNNGFVFVFNFYWFVFMNFFNYYLFLIYGLIKPFLNVMKANFSICEYKPKEFSVIKSIKNLWKKSV